MAFRTNETNKDYTAEIQNEPTNSFKPISYEISSSYEEISANVQELQADVTRIRNQFKERMVYMFNKCWNINYVTLTNNSHVTRRELMPNLNARRISYGRDFWQTQIH